MNDNYEIKVGDKVRIKGTDIEDVVVSRINDKILLKDNGYKNIESVELVTANYSEEKLKRLMEGDMVVFNELIPNALPQHIKNFELLVKLGKEFNSDCNTFMALLGIFCLSYEDFSKAMRSGIKMLNKESNMIYEELGKCINNITINKK